MNEKLKVRLGNPVVMFFWSFAMLLTGIVIGAHWHPSRAHSRDCARCRCVHHVARTCVVFCVALSVGVVDRPAHGRTQRRTLTMEPNTGRHRSGCVGTPMLFRLSRAGQDSKREITLSWIIGTELGSCHVR